MVRKKYKRILLKLTGELFGDKFGKGLDFASVDRIARQIINIHKNTGLELAIVVGGGNIFRGRERASDVDEVTADYMGMLATVINGLALQESLERQGVETRMMTAFEIKAVAEPYIRRRAIRHLEKGRIVILTAGVGSPFFTTDSAAALRAVELKCDIVFKATDVDGVYSADPQKDPKAKLYKRISFDKALKEDLQVMDATAFAICRKNKMPIFVFNIKKLDKISSIVLGKEDVFGTLVG
ncbi:MAG: uridylate kinase [Patescibacteria group bacterium]|nr:MAG: uridylate kinase [Patescibacteria group bacterium]